jgi:uncharacterized protein
MALVRILVDGYSLLHCWEGLAPGKPRHSATARNELIRVLTQYQDAVGTPITVVFDGAGAPPGTPKPGKQPIEILYSKAGQTADDIIERAAYRLTSYGEVLVVTDDFAERDTVSNLGGMASSCENFARDVINALGDMEQKVQTHNRRELSRYRNAH